MATQLWWRNPRFYIRELIEMGSGNLVFNNGYTFNRRLNALKFVHYHYGRTIPYRLIFTSFQHAQEVTYDRGLKDPVAVWPLWRYGEPGRLLENYLASPVGERKNLCDNLELPPDERPVFGQEHRVVVADLPHGKSAAFKNFLRYLIDLQEEFPEAIIHPHGTYIFKDFFDSNIRSVDLDLRDRAAKGYIVLPTGTRVNGDGLQEVSQWVRMLGFKVDDMTVPRNRCMYNIKSAEWAARNYSSDLRPRTTPHQNVDFETPAVDYQPKQTKSAFLVRPKFQTDDRILCSMCSVQTTCKFFRDGAVCSLPDAETTPLAHFFKTRDSSRIIDGLTTLVAYNASRLERAAKAEELYNDELSDRIKDAVDNGDEFKVLSPEVTKLVAQVFDQATKLAKLLDPTLRGSAVKVNINAGGSNNAVIASTTPQEMMGGIIRALEDKGVRREDITPEMVKGMLEGMASEASTRRAIEGQVVPRAADR